MPKYHIQKTPMFEQLKNMIYEFAGIEESAETSLPITVKDTYAEVPVDSKDQRIKVILKRKEEEEEPDPIVPGVYAGNIIKGTVTDTETDEVGNPLPVEGVLVELYESDGTTKAQKADGSEITARTGPDGTYTLSEVPGAYWDETKMEVIPKDYVVKFTYGDKEQFEIANSTKYNGNDYEAVDSDRQEVEEEIITELETEEIPEEPEEPEITEEIEDVDIYLLIDKSNSMRDKITPVRDAAKKFINNVFDEYGDRARIGIGCFSATGDHMHELAPTSGKAALEAIVDAIGATGTTTRTDEGIKCAKNQLSLGARDVAKKIMIILTDGLPDFTDVTNYEYINAANEGIEILTILYGDFFYQDKWKARIMQAIGAGQIVRSDEANIMDFFSQDVVRFVKGEEIGDKVTPKRILDTKKEMVTKVVQTIAEEDSARRNETIANIQDIENIKGNELKKLDSYDNTADYYTTVADLTYMTATGVVTMESLDINNDQLEKEMHLKLKKRPTTELELHKEVESVKVTLADGNILMYRDKDANNNIGTIIQNIGKQYLAVMDDELLHGATIEIKYKIEVTDKWDLFNSKCTVYDYIDEELTFDSNKAENAGWTIIDDGEKRAFTEDDAKYNLIKDKVIIKRVFDGDINNQEATFVVTRLLTTNSTDEYENFAEVVSYSNDLGRRAYVEEASGLTSYVPGDLPLEEMYKGELDLETRKHKDEAKAELVNIIPPFGRENSVFKNLSKYIEEKNKFLNKEEIE